jgi:hypothetical protein
MSNQEKFENLINNGKAILGTKCFIDKPLSDEINLSILKNKGIEELHFAKGEITRIYNVPRGLQTIVINDNHLTSIPSAELRDLVDLPHHEYDQASRSVHSLHAQASIHQKQSLVRLAIYSQHPEASLTFLVQVDLLS